jgi:hypothetical protein
MPRQQERALGGERRGREGLGQAAGSMVNASRLRNCTVSVQDTDGVTHRAQAQAESAFEAAARGVAAFREEGWATKALTANARSIRMSDRSR